jgi:hypothetical protein
LTGHVVVLIETRNVYKILAFCFVTTEFFGVSAQGRVPLSGCQNLDSPEAHNVSMIITRGFTNRDLPCYYLYH